MYRFVIVGLVFIAFFTFSISYKIAASTCTQDEVFVATSWDCK